MTQNSYQIEKLNRFTEFIETKCKSELLRLIQETTKEGQFPVINKYENIYNSSLGTSIDFLLFLINDLSTKNPLFKEFYTRVKILLGDSGILDKVAKIYAEYIRNQFPRLSQKRSTRSFASFIHTETKEYNALFIIFSYSFLNLMIWPFNEEETANLIVLLNIYDNLYRQLKNCLDTFALYENIGIDLTHLDIEKIAKRLLNYKKDYLDDTTCVSFFFYRNKNLKEAYIKGLKLDTTIGIRDTQTTLESVKQIEKVVEALELVKPSDNQSIIKERKGLLTKKLRDKTKEIFNLLLEEDTIVTDWKLAIEKEFEKVLNIIRIEHNDLGFYIDVDSLIEKYRKKTEITYNHIIKLFAEENFREILIKEIYTLFSYTFILRLLFYLKTVYVYINISCVELIHALLTEESYYKYTSVIYNLGELRAEDLVKKLIKLNYIIKNEITKLKNTSLDKILIYLKGVLAKIELTSKVSNILEKIRPYTAGLEKQKSSPLTIQQAYIQIRKYYSNGIISFENFLAALIRLKQKATEQDDVENKQEHIHWFIKRIEKEKINDIYKLILLTRSKNDHIEKALRGLYFLFIILNCTKKEFETNWRKYKPDIKITESKIKVLEEPNFLESIILAFIFSILLRPHIAGIKTDEIYKNLPYVSFTTTNNIFFVSDIELVAFEKIGTYLMEYKEQSHQENTLLLDINVKKESEGDPKVKNSEKLRMHTQKIIQLTFPF